MEFVKYDDALKRLAEVGVKESSSLKNGWKRFELGGKEPCRLHLAANANVEPWSASRTTLDRAQLPAIIEQILRRLRLAEMFVVPFSPWRNVFDTVAFSLAQNRAWAEVDATACVVLNTHDPLACAQSDLHTLNALMTALLKDSESNDQAITIAATGTGLIIELLPEGSARLQIGKAAIADELCSELALGR